MTKTLATPLSLNELNFYLTRAIFGIGGSFAVATECARACAWLVCRGFSVDDLIQEILNTPCPTPPNFAWQGEKLQCDTLPIPALYAGAVVIDHASLGNHVITLDTVDFPLLLAARVIPRLPQNTAWKICFGGQDHGFIIQDNNVWLMGKPIGTNDSVTIQPTHDLPSHEPLADCRMMVYENGILLSDTTWGLLWKCFHQTLVPSNAASTLQGAGAGTNDND